MASFDGREAMAMEKGEIDMRTVQKKAMGQLGRSWAGKKRGKRGRRWARIKGGKEKERWAAPFSFLLFLSVVCFQYYFQKKKKRKRGKRKQRKERTRKKGTRVCQTFSKTLFKIF